MHLLHSYERELPPKVYVSCLYSHSPLSLFLVVCLHACVLLSFLFVLILCIRWYSMFSYSCIILISSLFFRTFIFLKCLICFVLISVNPYFLHFYWYWFILNHISIWSISSTNHQSTNTNHEAKSMKTNTSCMICIMLYYDVRRHYDISQLRK